MPLVTIAVFTFNNPTGKFNTTWQGFTFDNWLHPFDEQATSPTRSCESLKVAIDRLHDRHGRSAALIALALARYRIRGGAAINLLLVLPLTTPEIVMGASLFTLFFNQGVDAGLLDDRHRPHHVLPVASWRSR